MSTKGGKKAKGEGDRSENISEDDGVGQAADASPIRHDLTPTMPAFAQGERSPPAVSDSFGASFTTRVEGNIPPDFRLDNELSLPEQLALAIHEQRFEDAKRLKAAMIAEQDLYNLEQQLALAVKDERFDLTIAFGSVMPLPLQKQRMGKARRKRHIGRIRKVRWRSQLWRFRMTYFERRN